MSNEAARSMSEFGRLEQALEEPTAGGLRERIQAGASPRAQGRSWDEGFFESILECAARRGKVEHLRALLEAGADVDQVSAGGFTPLMAAVKGGSAACVQELLRAGANPNRKETEGGETAGHLAIRLGRMDCLSELLEGGANPKEKDFNGSGWMSHAREHEASEAIGMIRAHREKKELKEQAGEARAALKARI